MCVECLRNRVDITELIPKQAAISMCKACLRWQLKTGHWAAAELESPKLLGICLKNIKNLSKVRLVDAIFLWTEPHSRRLKVQLTVQAEVFSSTVIEQVFIVEFIVHAMQCDTCQKDAQNVHQWKAVCQIRQKVSHKRTMLFLEQLILKHKAHAFCTNIREHPDGLDFYFQNKNHCEKFSTFFSQICPMRLKASEKLISFDEKSAIANMKFTTVIEVSPVCKEDLVFLPKKVASYLGQISQLVLCQKVSTMIHLIDPHTAQTAELSGQYYYKTPFFSLADVAQLTEFIVLQVEPLEQANDRYMIADVHVAKDTDYDQVYIVRTHLGYILNPGDAVKGYLLPNLNFNNDDIAEFRHELPDVVLVKKSFPLRRSKQRRRKWALQRLAMDGGSNKNATIEMRDLELFQQSLEEDREMRDEVDLFLDDTASVAASSDAGEVEPDFPEIQLNELLSGLSIHGAVVMPGQAIGTEYDDPADYEEEAT